jgi:ABC-type Na+ efflux pump permease subunit
MGQNSPMGYDSRITRKDMFSDEEGSDVAKVRLTRPIPIRVVTAAVLLALSLNSIALSVVVRSWSPECPQLWVVKRGAESLVTCPAPLSTLTRLLVGLSFAEIALHLALAGVIALGITTNSYSHRQTLASSLRAASLWPFSLLLPFGSGQLALYADDEWFLQRGVAWVVIWMLNHQPTFVVVALLQSVAAGLWVSSVLRYFEPSITPDSP